MDVKTLHAMLIPGGLMSAKESFIEAIRTADVENVSHITKVIDAKLKEIGGLTTAEYAAVACCVLTSLMDEQEPEAHLPLVMAVTSLSLEAASRETGSVAGQAHH